MQPERVPGRNFWLRWTIASALGSGTGVLLWIAVGAVIEAVNGGGAPQAIASRPWVPALIGAAFGIPFGTGQWIVLKDYLDRPGLWVVATALGYALVFFLGAIFFPQADAVALPAAQQILLGAGLGAAVALPGGTLQWLLVLRRQVPKSSWWVAASCVSWALGFGISFALRLAIGELTFVAGPLVSIALTGLVLVRLLRRGGPGPA